MNHPKMLYKGTQQNFQHTIANDQYHEDELKDDGWIEFGELPEREQDVLNPHDATKDSNNPFAELEDQLNEEREVVKKLAEENTHLKEVIEKGSAENADLREQLTFFQKEGLKDESAPDDYSELSVKELQNLLDEKQIKYLKNDNKATLLELLK